MRVFLFYFLILTYVFSFGQKNRNTIGFTENEGQIINQKGKANTAVLYLLNTPGLNVQLKKNSFSYDIYETKKILPTEKDKAFLAPQNRFGEQEETPNHPLTYNYHRIDIDFLNANANVQLVAEEKSNDYDNYYNVSHAPEGITNVHKYQKVTYKNLYNNIDAVFFIPNDSTKVVEYNFIVRPGGKISDIQLKFNGAKTELTDNKIKMKVRFGEMEETLPLSWIEQGNSRKEIAVGYKKIKKNVYGFEGDVNASDKTIVIDPVPVRLWGTYYGGGGGDVAGKITTDNMNNIYISGNTQSHTNIATAGTHMPNFTTTNPGFVVKFSFEGVRFWGTYYEIPLYEIAIDNNQNIYCTVTVFSTPYNITTSNSYQPIKNNFNDAYLVKFNSQGIREWATYYGGERNDYANGVACDYLNNVYIYMAKPIVLQVYQVQMHIKKI